MKYAKLFIATAIAIATIFGDYVVFKSKLSKYEYFRALADNLVHASIGLLSSIAFFSHENNISDHAILSNVAFCTVMSSLIDLDHVIAAKSFLFKDITNTKQRGIFHCTTFCLLLTLTLFMYSYLYKKINIYTLTWMLVVAFSSHQIRDGNRRGLWLCPFGHTPPIHTYLYVISCSILPFLFSAIYKYFKTYFHKYTTVDYVVV